MKLSVQEALSECAPFLGIAGTTDVSSPENLARLNSVRRMIYNMGETYVGCVGWMAIELNRVGPECYCTNDGGLTKLWLPLIIESVISAASANVDVRFVGRNHLMIPKDRMYGFMNGNSPINVLTLMESATKPPFAYQPAGRYSFFLRSQSTEDQQTIVLKTRRGSNVYQQKIQLNGNEYVPCGESVDEVLEVTKPVTDGIIEVILADCDGKPTNTGLAIWPANLRNPTYTEIIATSSESTGYRTQNCREPRCVLLYYRKKFQELKDPDELVDIESIEALQFGYKAKNYQFNDTKQYTESLSLMKNHLDRVDFTFLVSAASEEIRPQYTEGIELSRAGYFGAYPGASGGISW